MFFPKSLVLNLLNLKILEFEKLYTNADFLLAVYSNTTSNEKHKLIPEKDTFYKVKFSKRLHNVVSMSFSMNWFFEHKNS